MVAKDFLAVKATHVAVTFDAIKPFRYDIYPHYKEGRHQGPRTIESLLGSKLPEDLPPEIRATSPHQFIKPIRRCLQAAGILSVVVKGMESDDLMAAGAHCLSGKAKVVIETRDKDLMQMVDDSRRISIYWPKVGKQESRVVEEKDVKQVKGVAPSQIRDYLILTGDKSDNIPGVRGVDHKTAVKILSAHGSISKALKSGPYRKKLRENFSRMHLAKKLVTLQVDCWKPSLRDLQVRGLNETYLVNRLGKVPDGIEAIHAQRALSSQKGLFR